MLTLFLTLADPYSVLQIHTHWGITYWGNLRQVERLLFLSILQMENKQTKVGTQRGGIT